MSLENKHLKSKCAVKDQDETGHRVKALGNARSLTQEANNAADEEDMWGLMRSDEEDVWGHMRSDEEDVWGHMRSDEEDVWGHMRSDESPDVNNDDVNPMVEHVAPTDRPIAECRQLMSLAVNGVVWTPSGINAADRFDGNYHNMRVLRGEDLPVITKSVVMFPTHTHTHTKQSELHRLKDGRADGINTTGATQSDQPSVWQQHVALGELKAEVGVCVCGGGGGVCDGIEEV